MSCTLIIRERAHSCVERAYVRAVHSARALAEAELLGSVRRSWDRKWARISRSTQSIGERSPRRLDGSKILKEWLGLNQVWGAANPCMRQATA
jgi:hypothetical protein